MKIIDKKPNLRFFDSLPLFLVLIEPFEFYLKKSEHSEMRTFRYLLDNSYISIKTIVDQITDQYSKMIHFYLTNAFGKISFSHEI